MEVRIRHGDFKNLVESRVRDKVKEITRNNETEIETRVEARLKLNNTIIEEKVQETLRLRLFNMEKDF